MSESVVEWLGGSCGKHGSYTFYKGFKLTANGRTKKYYLGEFYFVRNSRDRPICIAELQLVWYDSNTGNQLASARLYFRPENTPVGRQNNHGEDELLYTDEKVVVKCRDMITLECDATEWCYGIKAISELSLKEVQPSRNVTCTNMDKKYRLCTEIFNQKNRQNEAAKIMILTFSAYCRYQSLIKKLSNGAKLSKTAIVAFGGMIKDNNSTWVLFSRECFHHPELDKFDMFSENKAPVLKGRPRKKKAKATAKNGKAKGKQQKGKSVASDGQNTADSRVLPESDSSDENQTDTSEDSSSGTQERLPCPPKLVSTKKEDTTPHFDMSKSVIRTVQQSGVVKPLMIPPMPKLVKIEPVQINKTNKFITNQDSVVIEAVPQAPGRTISRMENMPTLGTTSVISSTRGEHTRVSNIPRTDYSKISSLTARVSSPGVIATGQMSVPRTSAIVSTGNSHQAIGRAITDTENDAVRHVECVNNDLELSLKRKRGRPVGRPSKVIKGQENDASPLQPVEMNVEQINLDDETSPVEKMAMGEDDCHNGNTDLEEALEQAFMKKLKEFMKKRGTPIEKIPALGFKKINLYKMFDVTRSLGGYEVVTAKRLWRRVYNEVGGSPSITSAATNSRKHYERLLLPYEKYMSGQELFMEGNKSETPLPPTSKENDVISPTGQRDHNSNVIAKNDVIVDTDHTGDPGNNSTGSQPELQESKSSVEFITSGRSGSPIVLYSSPVEPMSQANSDVIEISPPPPPVQYESRPGVITSVGRDRTVERTSHMIERRSVSPELGKPAEIRSYLTEMAKEESRLRETSRNTATIRPCDDEYEYVNNIEHVNDRRATHAHDNRRECYVTQVRDNKSPEMVIHDVYNGRLPREVLMMNVQKQQEGKYRSHYDYSPITHDEPYLPAFTVPILQQSHYPHGVELYDLPNSGFPLRTSSRIFMPSSHQLYPAISPYPRHIITESGAVYQIPVPGYYPPDIPYPLEGMPVLRS